MSVLLYYVASSGCLYFSVRFQQVILFFPRIFDASCQVDIAFYLLCWFHSTMSFPRPVVYLTTRFHKASADMTLYCFHTMLWTMKMDGINHGGIIVCIGRRGRLKLKQGRQTRDGRKHEAGQRARRHKVVAGTFLFLCFKTHYVHGEPVRGSMVRRRSRTDSGSGQLIVPPHRVLFIGDRRKQCLKTGRPNNQRNVQRHPPAVRHSPLVLLRIHHRWGPRFLI